MSYSYYSYSKIEVEINNILLILNTTHDVDDFDSLWINIYKNHKICMIRIWTLQYSVEGCCLCLSSFLVNTARTKTVNVDEWFKSLESFMRIISTLLNLWIWMSRHMNQTYFECYKYHVVFILIATCTYKSMLSWVRKNHTQNYISSYE